MKYFLIILLIIFLAGFFVWRGIYLPQDSDSTEEIAFLVKKGEGAKEISVNLKEQGLIKYNSLFRVYVLVKGVAGELKAGEYELSPAMTTPEIVNKLASGEVIKKIITIIEGWNLRDIGWYFENKGMFMAEELFELAGFPLIDYSETTDLPPPKDFSQEFDFLEDKPENLGLEGYLFPDTYEISSEDGIEDIVRKILTNFDKKLTLELKEKITSQGKSIFEIITTASLLEKEVKTFKDKKIVSGILEKRLKNGIPLQVDATIIYITGKKTTRISKKETEIDSPYNTYRYRDLPLGPISNPGIESIMAAIYPEDSPYLYYLSTTEGETIFSGTLEEHNIAKAKYLK